ncbi:MAG: DMT family transporter [Paludibacter sp.]|jgi:transporter family protein|nr:DMT family transporter [Paludibacter sp.]
MWLILGLVSSLLLGAYDVSKKVSLQDNAVIPVLTMSIIFSSVILLPFVLISVLFPSALAGTAFFTPAVDFQTHLLLIIKAIIVLISWIFGYFGIKHLPITIASPIKATQPVWVVAGGILIFGEKLNLYQSIGVGITLVSFFLISYEGRKEVKSENGSVKWIWFVILATLTGAVSGLYDKYLIGNFNHMTVQTYYTIYQAILMIIVTAVLWYPSRKGSSKFKFRWSILFISLFLVAADFAYFYALTMPDSMISIVSTLRRAGVIVPFMFGVFVLHDKNLKIKSLDLAGVILGMVFMFLGSK